MKSHFFSTNNPTLANFEIFTKYLEYIVYVVYLLITYLFVSQLTCDNSVCQNSNVDQRSLTIFVGILIISYGLLTSLRTSLNYFNNSDSRIQGEYNALSIISVISQVFSYIFIGYFIIDLINRSQTGFISSPIFIVLAITIGVSIISLFFDRRFWEAGILFVKIRLILSLIFQVLLILNPLLAFIASFFIFPIQIFVREVDRSL